MNTHRTELESGGLSAGFCVSREPFAKVQEVDSNPFRGYIYGALHAYLHRFFLWSVVNAPNRAPNIDGRCVTLRAFDNANNIRVLISPYDRPEQVSTLSKSVMKISFLQANHGDAIHITFPDESEKPFNMLIDGGPDASYEDEIRLKHRVRDALNEEKARVGSRIQESIHDFFHVDLINTLYSSIDSHPLYTSVKFTSDVDDRLPTLDVIVQTRDGRNKIVPNLYYSSAQINVLCLSIFLARALKATDDEGRPVDCIFIDDLSNRWTALTSCPRSMSCEVSSLT